jgi:ABC-type multidrug transport system ATPase subunit
MGVITGDMFVDGCQRDDSFQRKTGYVQQQDLHLETSTVRESLTFSALLRQSRNISKADKLAYVEEVIKLLDMQDFAEAVVGVPGEGLNVEQRKRLTIGVELAAKPDLLLFLDEPTSGLFVFNSFSTLFHADITHNRDSQTAWSICKFMRKLANNGQAVLCTIHQPSAILMQQFDRLLFLVAGGKTVYFGDIGENCATFTHYFEAHGAHPCPPQANPAEWMLEVVGAAPGHYSAIDWYDVWRNSDEYHLVQKALDEMERELPEKEESRDSGNFTGNEEFAMPFNPQLWYCLKRVWEQYWRTPSYIYSKTALCTLTVCTLLGIVRMLLILIFS